MTTLHEFRVFADLPDDIDVIDAERKIAEAMHSYLAPLGNHAVTLVDKRPGANVLDHMAINGSKPLS